jgi:hypothetical protein
MEKTLLYQFQGQSQKKNNSFHYETLRHTFEGCL